jgi:hypothetical protein
MEPGEDLDQRRLARAVLADECVDLPGADIEVHVAQSLHAREGLADAPNV